MLPACGEESRSPAPIASQTPPPAPPILAIRGEARMLSGRHPVALSHAPTAIDAVYSFGEAGQRIDYAAGVDYEMTVGGIARLAGSRIPDYAEYEYEGDGDGRFSFRLDPRNQPRTLTYSAYVDYRTERETPMVAARPLPQTPDEILCLGDSITQGADTIGSFFFGRPDDGWCGLLASHLAGSARVVLPPEYFGFLANGVDALPRLTGPDTDTVIIAFRMNDHFYGEPALADFTAMLRRTVADLRGRGMNVLLVGFFQRNELFDLENRVDTIAYNAAIADVAAEQGLPFIDMVTAFAEATPPGAPTFLHLTADFIHHPNNYGQRIYFSHIVPYFLTAATSSDELPNYVVGPWSVR